MTTKTIKIQPLTPGQEVAVPNDSQTGRVIRRVRPGVYLVLWRGFEIEFLRAALSVRDENGRWVDYIPFRP